MRWKSELKEDERKKKKRQMQWNLVEKRALLGRCVPNHSTSLVPLYYYEITCCRRDAAIACTPHRRTSPQFRHAESRNDSYRLTPKPRITWHTGWRTARQPPSILRTVTSTGTGVLSVKGRKHGPEVARNIRRANQQHLLVS